MPLNIETLVLKAHEATTGRLNQLFGEGYTIAEKLRQADGTDNLILTREVHVNAKPDGNVTDSNSTMRHQAGIAQGVEQDPRPQSSAEVIHRGLDISNQATKEQRSELTKTFKKKK